MYVFYNFFSQPLFRMLRLDTPRNRKCLANKSTDCSCCSLRLRLGRSFNAESWVNVGGAEYHQRFSDGKEGKEAACQNPHSNPVTVALLATKKNLLPMLCHLQHVISFLISSKLLPCVDPFINLLLVNISTIFC